MVSREYQIFFFNFHTFEEEIKFGLVARPHNDSQIKIVSRTNQFELIFGNEFPEFPVSVFKYISQNRCTHRCTYNCHA